MPRSRKNPYSKKNLGLIGSLNTASKRSLIGSLNAKPLPAKKGQTVKAKTLPATPKTTLKVKPLGAKKRKK
jgi:hypothetical protein